MTPTPELIAYDICDACCLDKFGPTQSAIEAAIRTERERAVAAEQREMEAKQWAAAAELKLEAAERERDELRSKNDQLRNVLKAKEAEVERLNELCSRTVDQIAVWDAEREKLETEVERLRALLAKSLSWLPVTTDYAYSLESINQSIQLRADINAELEAAKQ